MNTATTAITKSIIDEQLEALSGMTLAFSHKTWHGALSMAWDAGVENVHAWSQRFWVGGMWQVQYEVRACPMNSAPAASPSGAALPSP